MPISFLDVRLNLDFYNIVTYNRDTVDVRHDYTKLAYMYFRIDVDEVVHTRQVYEFSDFLGDVGGITGVLTETTVFVIGGFLAWNAGLEMMMSLYSQNLVGYGEDQDSDKFDKDAHDRLS